MNCSYVVLLLVRGKVWVGYGRVWFLAFGSYCCLWLCLASARGNYWSDYSGVDLCTGPYQNLTEGIGSDGIGDTNYPIDGSNVDNYPLMIPWINQTPIHPLEGQYANYTVLSINLRDGSILDSLHWNLTYDRYVSPFLIYVESWNSDFPGTD